MSKIQVKVGRPSYFSELKRRQIQDHVTDPTAEANVKIEVGNLVLIQSDIKKRSLWEMGTVIVHNGRQCNLGFSGSLSCL